MRIQNTFHSKALGLAVFLLAAFISGCNNDDNTGPTILPSNPDSDASAAPINNTALTIISTNPNNDATAVPINNAIVATFSKSMDETTFTTETFTVIGENQPAVVGSVSLDAANNTSTFTPNADLSPSTRYTATITTLAKSSTGESLASNYVWIFNSGATKDETAPTVSSTNPSNTETDISVNRNISALFDEPLDPASINLTSFTLRADSGNTAIAGEVRYTDRLATFNPTDNLSASTAYTATLTTDIKDLAGNFLATNYAWEFTTNTPLTIISTNPHNDATAVPINNTIVATFSQSMDETTLNNDTFTVIGDTGPELAGSFSLDAASSTSTFTPSGNLTASTRYTATITTLAKSSTGQSLASDYVWTFTSDTTKDETAPTVSSTNPSNTETDIALNRSISALFDEPLDPASIKPTSFTLTTDSGNTAIAGEISYTDRLATFNPTDNLSASTVYTATLTTDIKDLAGNFLATNHAWEFTTATEVASGPDPVDLLTAGNFAILTKTGITNAHTSAITGNIGASPITASSMNNVFCSEITGTIYGADAAYTGSGDATCFAGAAQDNTLVANGVSDMVTAYNDAKGRANPDFSELHAGDISSKILLPGLYKWATTVAINADTTLHGGENDVWIFQIGTTVSQAANTSVLLTGGALAKNVFWAVGTAVTLGADTTFAGVVLAKTAITIAKGTTVNGRLLTQTAVTLDQNIITQPAP
jgi:hypothetical protein